ncbi:hypothetical protein LWI28_015702 [Acer negundo]|uniref:Uncharacterized protein n=1 Tax=Acer negundo TaxID=4023 RepID=A0AAD5NI15_ACENE|nr:hypothetical protein LWI28_015702 [Acer negundo]
MVMEIRPSIEWDKGHALEYLLDTLGMSNSNDVLPLYIRDDQTDENAFKNARLQQDVRPREIKHKTSGISYVERLSPVN